MLFEAGIHPKTFCRSLSHDDGVRLHDAIVKVMTEAVAEVARRGEPIEVKVRDFLKVRPQGDLPALRLEAPHRGGEGHGRLLLPALPARHPRRASWTGRAPESEDIIAGCPSPREEWMSKEDLIELQGVVIEVLAGGNYKVKWAENHEVLARLNGKMRQFRIRVIQGDRVTVGVSPYDLKRGLITYRAK